MTEQERFLRQMWNNPSCGLGCIIVPPDVDRGKFINRCYSTETISMVAQSGGFAFHNVPITIEALQYIEFPGEKETYGSVVVFLFHPKTNKPIVVGVLSKKSELYGVQWKGFKRFKINESNLVSVIGDAQKGNLFVTVAGDSNSSGGQIWVSIQEPQNKGVLKVSIQGDIQFISQNIELNCLTTKIVSKESVEVITKNMTVGAEEKIKLSAKEKVSIGEGNYENAIKGDTLKDLMDQLLDKIIALTVPTAVGLSGPPVNAADFAKIKSDLSTILSDKVELE